MTALPTETGVARLGEARPAIDLAAAAVAVRALLIAFGEDPGTEHLRRTPHRVAAAYEQLLTPEPFEFTTFANDENYDQLVLARDIPFRSLCLHHLLPFSGVAHVGYLPSHRIVGLSKLARVVQRFAARLQVQERLTKQISDCLADRLHPRGVGVVLEAEHQCMTLRGAQARDSRTITSALDGRLREDPAARQEFFALIRSR